MNEDFRIFLATIWGEAAGSSTGAQRAIASVIMNRVGVREWAHLHTPRAVIEGSGFDAFRFQNHPYRNAAAAFAADAGNLPGSLLALEDAVRAIYERLEPTVTPAVLYFSPRAQAAFHVQDPAHYRLVPAWNWSRIEEVQPPGILPTDDFRFFKYRAAQA